MQNPEFLPEQTGIGLKTQQINSVRWQESKNGAQNLIVHTSENS